MPILISELEAGGPAALTGQLYVGDAILAINDCDLTQVIYGKLTIFLCDTRGAGLHLTLERAKDSAIFHSD